MSVCVRPGQTPRRPVFSRHGSNDRAADQAKMLGIQIHEYGISEWSLVYKEAILN